MSAFTEAHFAAALLHCGPHCRNTCPTIPDCNSISHKARHAYRERVFAYFLDTLAPPPTTRLEHIGSDPKWREFWEGYLHWVDS